jgi:hypothetical protein
MITILSFLLGLIVLLAVSAGGRHLLYMAVFGMRPGAIDEDLEDRVCGWFVGTIAGWVLVGIAVLALVIGSAILGSCGVT